ncbi:MAG: hypothetical protein L3J35_04730 [Bacteroidales bacterium]|nr:hypothetical protein [Bacteroidales bacterium]
MRTIFLYMLILSLFVFKKSFGQEKRIQGIVWEKNRTLSANSNNDSVFYLEEKVKINKFKVYLLKDLKRKKKKKVYQATRSSTFEFGISQKKLKLFNYLEFISNSRFKNCIVKIDTITDEYLTIVLEDIPVITAKPAIYLYPETKIKVTIELNFKGKILNTYPKYDKNWTVIAKPDGTLLNLKDNRTYNYLFWDGIYSFPKEHFDYKSGFYIKKDNVVSFLQEKLSQIGLNNTEINDFIVYWLPELNKSNYNFIHFWISDNIDNSAFLNVTPKPNTTIRIFMEFKGYNNLIGILKLPEQKLPSFERKGFTLIEWGGGKIGERIIK